jgi:hypothetical protein
MTIRILTAGALLLAIPTAALGATGEDIRAAIAGNTIQGSRGASAFTEFYDPSGAVKGRDYVGQWSVQGNQVCISYRTTPRQCWGADINGSSIRWTRNGAADGTGTILRGNPQGLGKIP